MLQTIDHKKQLGSFTFFFLNSNKLFLCIILRVIVCLEKRSDERKIKVESENDKD